ncbi:unnamed protein product, partial [Rotaria sp. Silwood1]
MLILPELEANIPSSDGTFINQVLAKKFPSRTLESIKSRRKTTEYRILLQQICDCQAAQIIEGSYCTVTLSSDVNSTTVVNNSINLTEDNDNSNDCSSNDRLNLTVREADSTTYPNIRQYIQEKIINGYDVLLAPITREEIVLAIKQTNNKAAVGPDHVSLSDVQHIARNEL